MHHVVIADGVLSGVLLPSAPNEYWMRDTKNQVVPRSAVGLAVGATLADERDRDFFSIPQTVARLGHLLETLNFLHSRNVIVGDLRFANVLVSPPQRRPSTYLVDCDSVLLHGCWTLGPGEAELMRPDDEEDWPTVPNARTDLYKFALMAVGAVGKDISLLGTSADVVNHLPSDHGALLRSMLDMKRPAPAKKHLNTVARIWRAYVSANGDEFVFAPTNLKRTRWDGPTSSVSSRANAESPANRLTTTVPTSPGQFRTQRTGPPKGAAAEPAPGSRPTSARPAPSHAESSSSHRRIGIRRWIRAVVAASLLAALTMAALLYTGRVDWPWRESLDYKSLDPQKVALGQCR